MHPELGYALAGLIGLSLGVLGGGGSTLTVPILVYVVGYPARQAVAMSLAIVGLTSLVGAIGHWRAGNVRIPVAIGFGVVAMAGSYLGARMAAHVSGAAQLVLLSLLMIVAAVLMFRNAGGRKQSSHDSEPTRSVLLVAPVGFGVGVLTGLAGIGGGFMIVPALVLLLSMPIRQAVGTALLVITFNASAGFSGYLGHVAIPWRFLAGFTAVAMVGIIIGTRIHQRVPQAALKRMFAVFLVLVGGYMFYRNHRVLLGGSAQPAPTAAASH